jgi:hypothetical protein
MSDTHETVLSQAVAFCKSLESDVPYWRAPLIAANKFGIEPGEIREEIGRRAQAKRSFKKGGSYAVRRSDSRVQAVR